MSVFRFIDHLQTDRYYRGQAVHIEELPARDGEYQNLAKPLHREVGDALRGMGILQLYSHQAEAIDLVREGRNVVVVTSTASGKTFAYLLPILDRVCRDPEARALLVYPTKALTQDQLRGMQKFSQVNPRMEFTAGCYDGDTPADQRRSLRDKANCILTNPDMLHRGILPNHNRWASFFGNLRFVVLDEVHTYRGIFGSHVSNVMRRLERICRRHGSNPVFICCSATIANPKELAERMAHTEFALVDKDGAPRGPKKFVLWNPPFIDDEKTTRRSPNTEATNIMRSLINERIQTIAFTRTRIGSELILRYLQDQADRSGRSLGRAVRAYRGGYLPEERREIERMLASGELLGVASTNALELGIDIGSLDVCVIVGYPGTIASTWQQSGRAGRGQEEAAVFLIGQNSPIDQYLMHHTEYLFGQSPEHAIIDPDNPHIAIGHLRCALAEFPLEPKELDLFGKHTLAMLDILAELGEAGKARGRWQMLSDAYPAGDIELRTMTDAVYTIQDATDETKVIGTIDELSAYSQVHTNAIYLHAGDTYFVDELDTDRKIARVTQKQVDYYTQSVDDDKLLIDEEEQHQRWRKAETYTGEVRVITNWLMFKKVKFNTRESIGFESLELPTYTLETTALWLVPPASSSRLCREHRRALSDGLIGIANLFREVLPLYVMCDPNDVGAVVESSNLGVPTLFIFDKYEGGIGFAENAYGMMEEIMQSVLEMVQDCPCHNGCPSCVGSAITVAASSEIESGTRDRFPDKEAALIILHDLLELPAYQAKYPPPDFKEMPGPEPLAEEQEIEKVALPSSLERKIRKRVRKYQRRSEDKE